MKKVLVIGCPGAGKSTFARKLTALTGLPLHYLDMIWHRPDRTTISREEFDKKLDEILLTDEWIIDGNYLRTLPQRLAECDQVFFFDLPTDICLEGAISRLGRPREDMPWSDDSLDEEFRQWIIDFNTEQRPVIELLLTNCNRSVTVFKSRNEADLLIDRLSKLQG